MAMPLWVKCLGLAIYVSLLIFSLFKIPACFKYRRKRASLLNQKLDQSAIEKELEKDYISIEMVAFLLTMSLFGSITFGAEIIL